MRPASQGASRVLKLDSHWLREASRPYPYRSARRVNVGAETTTPKAANSGPTNRAKSEVLEPV